MARELAAAERAFQRGDWWGAARGASAVARRGNEGEAEAARATIARFRTDPAVPLLFAAAILFFVLVIAHYA